MFNEFDEIIEQGLSKDLTNYLVQNNCCITGKGTVFKKTFQGFLPELMEEKFNQRDIAKRSMLEAKKDLELIKVEMSKRGLQSYFQEVR